MAIGTPRLLGTDTGSTSVSILIGAAVNAGDLIVVVLKVANSATITTASDTAGDTFSIGDNTAAVRSKYVYVANAAGMAAGSNITVNFSASASASAVAFAVSGIANASPVDKTNNIATGTGTSATSVSTGTLAQADELVIGILANSTNITAFVPGGSFTTISTSTVLSTAYQIVASTAAVSWAPSWTSSTTYDSDVISFKGAAASVITTAEIACAAQTVAEEPLRGHYLPSVEAY
jgi:hypothetical protein